MKKRDNRSGEALTEEQSQELAYALADGFRIYGHLHAGTIYPLEGIVDEPFFGAQVSAGGAGDVCYPDFVASMRNEGCTEDEILSEYEDYLDSQVSEDAPHWRETNPFNFKLKSIEVFFWKRYMEHYGAADNAIESEGDPLGPGAFLICEEPYSKTWFELHVLAEIELMQICLDDVKQGKSYAGLSLSMALDYAGSIGRLVENYRWRFSHGSNALRGAKSVESGKIGAEITHAATRAKIRPRFEKMKALVPEYGVDKAAAILEAEGMGTFEANKKLWNRWMARQPK